MSDCPKPIVDRAQRPCWVCDKIGHLGRDCAQKKKKKKKKQVFKVVTEQGRAGTARIASGVPMPCWNVDDADQHTDVRCFKTTIQTKHATERAFPKPTHVTMGMHLTNKFCILGSLNDDEVHVPNQTCCSFAGQLIPTLSQKARKAERVV